MTANSSKSIALAILASIFFIVISIIVLQNGENNAKTLEKTIVVEVEPISLESEQAVQLGIRDSLVLFAQQFMEVPYKYGSCDPKDGFDCSGFVYFVFRHFGIDSPRSSKHFVNAGRTVSLDKLQKGDVLVFTGTDSSLRIGGHVGIVLSAGDTISFIHSSSGSAKVVTISTLEEPHYRSRFMLAKDLISM